MGVCADLQEKEQDMDEWKEKTDDILERRLNREDRRPRKHSARKRKKEEVIEDSLMGSPEDMYGNTAQEAGGKPRKKRGPLGCLFRILLLLILLGLIWLGVDMAREYFRKSRPGGKEVEITVEKGDGLSEITKELKTKGVVKYGLPFVIKVRSSGKGGDLRYGTFVIDDRMSLDDILKIMTTKGATRDQYILTIPEGYSVQRIAALLEKKGLMDGKEFLEAVKNYQGDFAYRSELPDPEKVDYTLQGYLFPDTYYLDKDVDPDQLIAKMLANFEKHFPADKQEKAKAMNMKAEEVVTRASLVQQETVLPKEYPIVADVLTNRLAINMNLQLDSTVVYAITGGLYNKEKVYYNDLKVDSLYNTYIHKGLPVGPICCPGEEAIDAVLNPDDNNYLYFQTDSRAGDGSNLFFETYEEHSSAQATTATQETETEASESESSGQSGQESTTAK